MKEKMLSEKQLFAKTLTAFAVFLFCIAGAIVFWHRLRNERKDGDLPVTLRGGLNANEQLFSAAFSPARQVPTYPVSQAVSNVRVNGDVGLKDATFDTATWKLLVIRRNGDSSYFSLSDIKRLPKTDIVFDFKCIEGWSQKTWWGGARFSDFIRYYHLEPEARMMYAGMQTPDQKYYVGIDMPSLLQQQTLLCYEMNGRPLPLDQGAPLRLIIPVKYGIKHIKRIGTIYFSDQRPPDYWAERGYDYYAGH